MEIGKNNLWWSYFTQKFVKETIFKIFLYKWLANLHGFANICKLPKAQTFKVMQYQICEKVVFHKYLKFCFYKVAKNWFLMFYYCSCANFHFLQTVQKWWKVMKTLKLWKNYGHFWIPHPQVSLHIIVSEHQGKYTFNFMYRKPHKKKTLSKKDL